MKRSLSLLLAVIFIFLLAVPASAKSIGDLESVCTGLKEYLYTPYVSDSPLYPAYEDALSKAQKVLQNPDATPSEIDAHYSALKSAFAAMFRDCFDYSVLDLITKDYESLSSSLFEQDTWEKLDSVMKVIYKEIESPTLFKRGEMDKASYAANIQKFLNGHYTDFVNAYNQLKLKPLTEISEVKELVALLNYCNLSAPEVLMSQSSHWPRYQNACKEVNNLSFQDAPTQESIDLAAKELLESYQKLSADCFDLSAVKKELDRNKTLFYNHYSKKSWDLYQKEIEDLKEIEKNPQFIYLGNVENADSARASIQSFFAEKAKGAYLAFESLVPQENINKLSALCNTYHNATASQGAEVKLKLLLDCVDRGYKVLANETATANEIDKAIEEIENAAENLFLAEEYLSSEQNNNAKNDVTTIRYILIFTFLTLVLSFVCACFYSFKQFGRINWQR